MFGRPVTEEEIQQILRDRAERLDPANRPPNSEVDNSVREWDYELGDFKDSLVNGRARPVADMAAHGPVVERPGFLRFLGVGLTVACLFFVWLTWAFFTQLFTEYDTVTVTASKSGLSLPKRADVKLRGMIVGTVQDIHVKGEHVVMTLGMDPELIKRVPANVRAEIVPKTLFGEKYIDLIPEGANTGEHLEAGDTIANAQVPIEFEQFFNDVYPILTAVPPEQVATTLTALAETLEGRGDSLGNTLVETNSYLAKLNPETQQAVDDILDLGKVSDSYAGQMDNFGELLRNSADIADTIVDKRKELGDFFDETDDLAAVLEDLLADAGDDIVATAKNSRQPLTISNEYSSMFPCFIRGLDTILREHYDTIFRNGTLHLSLKFVAPQATAYDVETERPVIPKQSALDAADIANPNVHGYNGEEVAGLGTICDHLNAAADGKPIISHDNPLRVPTEYWKLLGVKNSHNGKLGDEADYNRAPLGASNLTGVDSPAQRKVLQQLAAGVAGVPEGTVPDVASLLLSPVVRGASIEASTAR